ncbi:Com family DNA-binding transcriptional regulator [Chromohalobacter israelensis]|uniref:Com family DNA-binding transcriptional regulator n=1 Tax=Chromohalobacter israelensis TaxID=141390 RepID=UPI00351CF3BA
MTDIRCTQCGRKLARASVSSIIEIKCPRCRHINHQRATSSQPMPNKEPTRGLTDHSLDGRQTPSRRQDLPADA